MSQSAGGSGSGSRSGTASKHIRSGRVFLFATSPAGLEAPKKRVASGPAQPQVGGLEAPKKRAASGPARPRTYWETGAAVLQLFKEAKHKETATTESEGASPRQRNRAEEADLTSQRSRRWEISLHIAPDLLAKPCRKRRSRTRGPPFSCNARRSRAKRNLQEARGCASRCRTTAAPSGLHDGHVPSRRREPGQS